MYSIGSLIGYFLVMIVLVVAAILLAKRTKFAWLVYALGVVLQILPMIANQRKYAMYGMSFPVTYWVVFLVIAVIGAALVKNRRDTV